MFASHAHARSTAAIFCACSFVLPAALSCGPPDRTRADIKVISGRTMGTSYQVRIAPLSPARAHAFDEKKIRARIQGTLDELDNSLSNWKPRSEVSRFNASRHTRPFPFTHPDAALILRDALDIARATGGAFDPTVSGLVELWGFGTRKRKANAPAPADAAIRAVQKRTGFARIKLTGSRLRKTHPDTTINLSAIAKGHAADLVFKSLRAAGYKAVMVEIGGEVRVGLPPKGRTNWRIGIEAPNYKRGGRRVHAVASLRNRAMATSGDYRNYFKIGERHFSHIIDPRTGRPTMSRVVSATIIGPSCRRADAFATAMLVMGLRRGLRFIESRPGYEALLLVRDEKAKTGLREHRTSGMKAYLSPNSK